MLQQECGYMLVFKEAYTLRTGRKTGLYRDTNTKTKYVSCKISTSSHLSIDCGVKCGMKDTIIIQILTLCQPSQFNKEYKI